MFRRLKTIKRAIKKPFQRAVKGYSIEDLWNLDMFITSTLKNALIEFEKATISYPPEMTNEQWHEILKRMIYLLEQMDEDACKIQVNYSASYQEINEQCKARTEYMEKCKNEFYDLLKEYHWNLWW